MFVKKDDMHRCGIKMKTDAGISCKEILVVTRFSQIPKSVLLYMETSGHPTFETWLIGKCEYMPNLEDLLN